MTQKFKVGDLVYCRYYKRRGIVTNVNECRDAVSVTFSNMDNFSRNYDLEGKAWLGFTSKKSTLKKVKTFTPKDMLDFANYCIGEGFTSNATKRDLVTFLNSLK